MKDVYPEAAVTNNYEIISDESCWYHWNTAGIVHYLSTTGINVVLFTYAFL